MPPPAPAASAAPCGAHADERVAPCRGVLGSEGTISEDLRALSGVATPRTLLPLRVEKRCSSTVHPASVSTTRSECSVASERSSPPHVMCEGGGRSCGVVRHGGRWCELAPAWRWGEADPCTWTRDRVSVHDESWGA